MLINWTSLKLKTTAHQKHKIKKINTQDIDWEKILAIYASDKIICLQNM